jgi:hypothetical protein
VTTGDAQGHLWLHLGTFDLFCHISTFSDSFSDKFKAAAFRDLCDTSEFVTFEAGILPLALVSNPFPNGTCAENGTLTSSHNLQMS